MGLNSGLDRGHGKRLTVTYVESIDVTEACVQRLAAEFPGERALDAIIATVAQSQRDLIGEAPDEALPELVERLARVRLVTPAHLTD